MNKFLFVLAIALGTLAFSPDASAQRGRGDGRSHSYGQRYDDRHDGYRRDHDGHRYHRGHDHRYRGRGPGYYRGRRYGYNRPRHYGWHGVRGYNPRCVGCRAGRR